LRHTKGANLIYRYKGTIFEGVYTMTTHDTPLETLDYWQRGLLSDRECFTRIVEGAERALADLLDLRQRALAALAANEAADLAGHVSAAQARALFGIGEDSHA
jgi:hypothetical protein